MLIGSFINLIRCVSKSISYREFSYESIGKRIVKIGPLCQSYYQRSRGILFWDTVYKVTHWAKTNNASASHKEGMLNWWRTRKPETRVWKKGRVCTPYHGLCVIVRRAPLDIIVPRLCPGRKKFLAPPHDWFNKCIGDDTKAAARQSLNCIKNQNVKYGEERFSVWRMEFLTYTMQCGTIMTLISPGDCTLQCARWLWDDMPSNSPKRPPYWNATSVFDFDHITAVGMSFCTSLRNFI